MNFSRHVLFVSLGFFLLAAVLTGAYAQTVGVAELMAPGPLPDRVLGNEKAPITIVEYASPSCTHCAHFYREDFPTFKKKYIDTGKVRFIMRGLPLSPTAASAFALARCQSDDKYYPTIELLFEQQKNWASAKPKSKALFAVAKQVGFTRKSFKACMADKKLSQAIDDEVQKAKVKFGVKSLPTFFINGQMMQQEKTLDGFDKALEPLLKGS
jgi:protein-disulfide isomerase